MARLLCLLAVAVTAHAQPPVDAPEAFTFNPQAQTLRPARPYWWQVAVRPDGKEAITAHATYPGGAWWAWDLDAGTVTATVKEPNEVRFVRYSPDGSLVAAANFDNAVRVYDAKTRTLLAYGHAPAGGHSAGVNALAFNADGSLLATAGLDKTARLWDVAAAVKRARAGEGGAAVVMAPRLVVEGFESALYAVALSPDGKKLVTGGQDGSVVRLALPDPKGKDPTRVKAETGTRLSGHGITVECVAWSADGQRIASGSWDNTAKLYDADGADVATLKGHNRGVMALAFSPDSRTLATVSGDHTAPVGGEVRLWDAADGKERGLLGKHTDMALGVGFTGDGGRLVTVGRDRALRIWDLAKRAEVKALRAPGDAPEDAKLVHAIAYAPDGGRLAVAGEGGAITVWDLKTHQPAAKLEGHTDTVYALAWSSDGSRLASASGDRTAIVWDVAGKKPLLTLKHPGAVYAVAVSPDGKRVATGGFDKVIRLWDAAGAEVGKREGHIASVRCLAFRPDGSELASGGADYTVRRWSLTDGSVRELRAHTKPVRSIAYVGSGALASAGDDGRVRVWDLSTDEPRHTFGPYPDGVPAVAASPRGTFLVAGLGNGKVHVLDPVEGQTRAVLSGPTDAVAAIAVSPTGQEIAAGGFDREVRLWSAGAKPAAASAAYPHPATVRAVAVAPGGAVVATGDEAGTIRLFDAATGTETRKWPAHDGPVLDLAFSGDGRLLASGGADKKARLWTAADGTAGKSFDHPGPVRRVALSAKGAQAATASSDREVRVFDLAAAVERKLDNEAPAQALQFLADDTLLAAAGPRAYLWDVAGSRVLNTLDGGQFARITAAAATADGKLIVLAGDPTPGSQRPEDVGNCRVLAVSNYHAAPVSQRMNDTGVGAVRLAVSPDARTVCLAGGDGTVRVWDWPTLTPIKKFPAHTGAILGLAVSARGEFLVSASADGTARRWNAARGEPLVYAAKLTDESKQAWFARLSPDGKVLATGGDDKLLRLRDALPGAYKTLPGDYPCAFSAAVTADGATVATGHLDGSIRLWDLAAGKQTKKLEGHAQRVWSLAFSPDGTRLVSGGGRWDQNDVVPGELRVWDTATWKAVHEFAAHEDLVFQVAVAPDGKTFASCSRDGSVIIHDLKTGKPVHTLRLHSAGVRTIAYTKDGERLYSGGFDGRLQWWDPVEGKGIDGKALGVASVERIRLSPDGKTLALALNARDNEGYPALWDVEKNELVKEFPKHDGSLHDVAFSPDGRTLVSAGGRYQQDPRYQPGPIGPWGVSVTVAPKGKAATTRFAPASEIRLWDVPSGSRLAELPGHKHWVENVQFTPDGGRLVAVSGTADRPGEIRVWDLAGVRPRAVLSGHTGGLTCARFSPDGTKLATGSTDSTISVWDVAKALAGDATARVVLKGHRGLVRNLAWFPDGTKLVTSGEDGTVKVWNPAGGEPTLSIAAADRPVYGVAVSADGALIATAAGDWKNLKHGELRAWSARTGAEAFRLPDTDAPAWGVAFLPDGKLAASISGDPALRVYDPVARREVKALTAPTPGRGIGLSGDGSLVGITAQGNGVVKLWETKTWREAYEIVAHPNKVVFAVEFAPDGQTVLTAGGDGAVVVWKRPGGAYTLPDQIPPPPAARSVENPDDPANRLIER